MKPTTEDFLIPFDVALARVCPEGELEDLYVGKAVELRLRIAIKAHQEHTEKLQQLADQWVKENEAAYFQKASDSRFAYGSRLGPEYRHNLDKIWNSMRDEADPIFRDYITKHRPNPSGLYY